MNTALGKIKVIINNITKILNNIINLGLNLTKETIFTLRHLLNFMKYKWILIKFIMKNLVLEPQFRRQQNSSVQYEDK